MKLGCLVSLVVLLLIGSESFAQCISGDCYDGRGTYKYPSGAVYTGTFIKGKINGTGTLNSKNGNRYTGQWKDHYKHGQGIMHFTNGDLYKGSLVKELMPFTMEINIRAILKEET